MTEAVTAHLATLTDHELRCLDHALVAIGIDPCIGQPLPGTRMHDYRNAPIRVIYHLAATGTIVIACATIEETQPPSTSEPESRRPHSAVLRTHQDADDSAGAGAPSGACRSHL